MTFKDKLDAMDACQEALDWVGRRGLMTAWRDCTEPDSMLRLAVRLNIDQATECLASREIAMSGYIGWDGSHYTSLGDNETDWKATSRRDADIIRAMISYEQILEAWNDKHNE